MMALLLKPHGIALLLAGLMLGLPDAMGSPERVEAPGWEFFKERFWRPLPGDRVSRIKEQQTLAYGHHLLDPKNPAHFIALGSFHFHLLEFNQAASWYLRILEQEPGNTDAQAWFAECLYHAGSIELAIPILEALASTKQVNPVCRILRAEVHFRKQQYDAASTILEEVQREAQNRADDPRYKPYKRFSDHVAHNLKVLKDRQADS